MTIGRGLRLNGPVPATRPQAAIGRHGYRLRLSSLSRWGRTALLVVTTVIFVDGVVAPHGDTVWRVLSVVGLVLSVWGLRILHGPAVVLRASGLRLQPRWPLRRDVAWYQVFAVEVVPMSWNLELELNSGERLALPCVAHVDDLYERIERARAQLGS